MVAVSKRLGTGRVDVELESVGVFGMNVTELNFEQHPSGIGGTRAVVNFDNGFGASVITGERFYTNEEHPYELAVLKNGEICYETELTDDVLGYLNEEQVNDYLVKIEALPSSV